MSEMAATPEGEAKPAKKERKERVVVRQAPPQGGGAVYGLGMIGALVYFAGTAVTGRDYALAFAKAMVWPAILVYRAFRYLDR